MSQQAPKFPPTAEDRVDRLLRFPEVRKLTGVSRTFMFEHRAKNFPAPVKVGGSRIVAWRESEIQAWINAQKA